MKTQEELQHELFKQTSEVEDVLVKLDKASMLLGHWEAEYVFANRPDLREAVKGWTSRAPEEESIKAEQSLKWFYEYSQIIGLVDIAFDYVIESKKLLEKVVYGEKENMGAA